MSADQVYVERVTQAPASATFAVVADSSRHQEIGGRIWRCDLEPAGDGTLVRETWDVSQDKQRFFLKKGSMPDSTGQAMTTTLGRLAELLEC